MKKLRLIPLHPFLVASFQVLSIYAANSNQTDVSATMFVLFLAVSLTALLFLLVLLITRDVQRSGVIGTFYCFLFFTYGRVYDIAPGLSIGGSVMGRNKYLFPIFIVVAIVGTLWVLRSDWLKKSLGGLTYFFNMLGLGLVAISVLTATASFDWTSRSTEKETEGTKAGIVENTKALAKGTFSAFNKPNVYFLIFDSYPNSKVLQKYYGWNDHAFVDSLRSLGFIVNENTSCNYPFTGLSIASTLNMRYIHEEPGFKNAKSKYGYLRWRIEKNNVIEYFRSEGYEIVMPTIWVNANDPLKKDSISKVSSLFSNELMRTIVHVSILRVVELELMADFLRNDILSAARVLTQSDKPNRPTFLYSHIVCPHPPYIFRADGSRPSLIESAWGRLENRNDFVEQVRFVGTMIIGIVDGIRKRDQGAVIIVQADHGHGYIVGDHLLNREKPPSDFLEAQYGILNAISLPYDMMLPEQYTPLNQFRYLFNTLFDAKLDILPDKAFFTPIKEPYVFYEVTGDLKNLKDNKH